MSKGSFFQALKSRKSNVLKRLKEPDVAGTVSLSIESALDELPSAQSASHESLDPMPLLRSPRDRPPSYLRAVMETERGDPGDMQFDADGFPQVDYDSTDLVARAAIGSSTMSNVSAIDAEGAAPSGPILRIGEELNLRVNQVETHAEPTPYIAQFEKDKAAAKKDIHVLPKHLNNLFNKICGLNKELLELDESTGFVHEPTPEAVARDPSLATGAAEQAKNKLKYGVLMDSYEKDQFAIKHQLRVAGTKFERRFTQWQGVHVLDESPGTDLLEAQDNKAAIVVHGANQFSIPKLGRDPCPGCGAVLQSDDEEQFGYITEDHLGKYVQAWQRTLELRQQYADRMYELQSHWDKHGKRVGEEWLDFMTQDEFNAIYRWRGDPAICDRCYQLQKHSLSPKTNMTAPNFAEKLATLKDQRCVIVLVVDVTDYPGSMVPDLPGLVAMNNPVLIAANKVDCIIEKDFHYTGNLLRVISRRLSRSHIAHWVREQTANFRLPQSQIKHIFPVSASKGWGVEHLVSSIENLANLNLVRDHKPLPVYFVGASNVGKSSLLNRIAAHLSVEEPPFPGAKKIYYSFKGRDGKERVKWKWDRTAKWDDKSSLPRIGGTLGKIERTKMLTTSKLPGTTVDVRAVKISLGNGDNYNFFDTPGVHPHWFEASPLTVQQLMKTQITKFTSPRFYILTPGSTFFLSAFCAIDIVKGPDQLLFAAYHSDHVKCDLSTTANADQFWLDNIGTRLWPPGDVESLDDLRLTVKRSYVFECFSKNRKTPKADIYVCGIGWISFCTIKTSDVVLRVRTLPGVVHGVRPPLRIRDVKPYRPWPKLPMKCRVVPVRKRPMETVVKLTNEPVNLNEPPLKLVVPEAPPEPEASRAPLNFLMEKLSKDGRLM